MKKMWLVGIIILILSTLFIHAPSSFLLQAAVIERNNEGIPDFYLYNELLIIANEGRQTPYLKLETDALINKEEISITNSQIESLEGLHLLNLNSLKTLNLSANKIKTVSAQNLSTAPNLEVINLSFNNITQIDISHLQNLNTLILENNKIAQIDISNIIMHTTYGNGYVNLKNNMFTQLSNITLPSEQSDTIIIDLNNNYLVNQNPNLYTQTHELELLVQGIIKNDSLLESTILQVYETNYYENFNLQIYEENEQFVAQLQEGQTIELTPNSYIFYYFNHDIPLYSQINNEPKEFTPVSFTIRLQKPSVEVAINNQIVEKKPTYNKPIELIFSAYNSNTVIYYSINNGEWKAGNNIQLTKNGQYTLRVKSQLNNMESEITQFTLRINESFQNTQNVIKVVVSLTAITLILMAGYFYYKKRAEQ